MLVDELFCHGDEVGGFAVGVADGAYDLVYVVGCGSGEGLGCGVGGEELGGDEVDALVGALG